MTSAQAFLADADLDQVEEAGLGSSQTCLARIRSGFARVLATRGAFQFSAQAELLNHLAPALSKTMAVAHLMGQRRSMLMARAAGVPSGVALDRFSEVMRLVRKAGLGEDLTRLQRGYARRVYDSMRHLGADVDAKTRAVIASLIADKEPQGRAMKVLQSVLDKLGVGGQSQSKLETIYRTEASIAYHAGRWQHDQSDPSVWGYRYVTMRDDRVRDEHVALDGTTLPKSALFWRRYWPPNGWNCRCQVETLYKKHKEKLPGKIDGAVPPPDDGFGQLFDLGDAIEFALEHDVSDQKRAPKGSAEGGQWVREDYKLMPSSTAELHFVETLGGTTGAMLYQDKNGKKYVLKKGASEEHAINEYQANKMYELLGVPVPKSVLVYHDGQKALLTEFIEGKTLNKLSSAEQAKAEEQLRKHFAADALLGNWDVVGLSKDNIVVDAKGVPWRIDNGGALAYRAKGATKGDKWNDSLGELKSMRETGVAGQVFGKLSNSDVENQVTNLVASGRLNKLVAKTKDKVLLNRAVHVLKIVGEEKQYPWKSAPAVAKVLPVSPVPATQPSLNLLDKYNALHNKINHPLQKLGLVKSQIEKTALANAIKDSPTHVYVSSGWTDDVHQKIATQFPGKKIKSTALGPIIKGKLGMNTTEVTKAKKAGKLNEVFAVTASEKKIALGMAKTAKEKAAAEALEVVNAKPAEFYPTSGVSKHWDKRVKIENGDTIKKVMETGNWADISDKAGGHNLALHELNAISGWKGSAKATREAMLAGAIEDPSVTGVYADRARSIASGCDKLPSFEGVVYRGVSHVVPGTKYYDAMHKVGNVIEFEAHACSSRNSSIGAGFASNVCLMRIAQKSGAAIEEIGGCYSEREVVQKRGTKYRVVGFAHDITAETSYGKTKIALFVDLEEVGPHEKSTEKLALSYPLLHSQELRRSSYTSLAQFH